MKIWITFDSVRQLQFGGLERCRIWFQKPRYIYVDRKYEYSDLPFGGSQKQGLCPIGWNYSQTNGKETGTVSLGKIFNYKGSICDKVWEELCGFFESEDLRVWDLQMEKLKKSPRDFLLELDVSFTLK